MQCVVLPQVELRKVAVPGEGELTSVLENSSLSTNSLTPISCMLVSANATPTVLTLSLTCSLSATMTGAASKSVLVNRRFSTAVKFPGDALLARVHFVVPRPTPPPSGCQISTRSCFVVSASRRKACATACERTTEGRPSGSVAVGDPRYLRTVCVLKWLLAT